MTTRLAQLRELAVQSTHEGERVNALTAAAREQGSSLGFEAMICRMEQRARKLDDLHKGWPTIGFDALAKDQRDTIVWSFTACSR